MGPPRSGVETLQWALRLHPDLWGAERSGFLAGLVDSLRLAHRHAAAAASVQDAPGRAVPWEELLAAVGRGVNQLITGRAGDRRWVDQTDGYVHYLADLAAMFPGADFVVAQRDGRAAVAAMRRQVDPLGHDEACRAWAAAVVAARRWAERGGRAHTVAFEELVADPAPALAAAFDHLGLRPSKAPVAFIEQRSPRPPAPPPAPWAAWTRDERRTFVDIAGAELVRLGYAPDHSWAEAAS